jgi:acyl-CoA oxidase
MGFNEVDNGFMRLNRVKIPRAQLLMNSAVVTREGKYIKSSHDKLTYASMIAGNDVIMTSSLHN